MCKLKNSNQDHKAWIAHLEGLRMKLGNIGCAMTDEDLMVHIIEQSDQ